MYTAIPKHFPNAILMSEVQKKILAKLETKKIEPEQTLWATSICSDEVNNFLYEFNELFAGPGPFRMGGISGLPFTGITGLKAFLSHVPTHGSAMIFYGPHIGVSKNGLLGQVNRQNQFGLSTCCGSLVAALSAIENHNELPTNNPLDYQQARVIQHLHGNRDEILNSEFPLKNATDLAFEAIDRKLNLIIDSIKEELQDLKILLVGGIVINTDWNIEDYFDIRKSQFLEF